MDILKNFALRFFTTSFTLTLLCFAIPLNVLGQFRVTIKLHLPANNGSDPGGRYFLASEYNKWLSADSSYRFKRINGVYQLSFLYNSKYWLQYKITRGTKDSEESDMDGYGIGNRMLNVKSDTAIDVTVLGWKNLIVKKHTYSRNVKILSDNFPIKSLNRTRQIWIYLPPCYNKSKKRYPVIYMQDGSELFDRAATDDGKEWRLDEKLDSLYTKDKIEAIVVGIASDEHRDSEYAPYPTSKRPNPEGIKYLNFLSVNWCHTLTGITGRRPARKIPQLGEVQWAA
ncbi:MAG TPA: alpha/beta hydrolase-fold protein [Candidatus Babeliaceae bacterium]|nr:alpha/beta hydrolase-fold protein [Candidatus Babeliaceae bacterium]